MRGRDVGLGLLAAAAFLVAIRAFWRFTVDDAYITLRYAEHLASGAGLRWNLGGGVVEGSTTFLWTVLLAAADALGLSGVSTAKVLGTAAAAATLPLVWLGVRRLVPEDRDGRLVFAWLAVAWTILLPETTWHAVSGMETAAFTFLVTLFALQWIGLRDARAGARAVALTGLLLGLMRPDGNVLAAGTLLIAPLLRPDAQSRAFARDVALFYLIPGAVYFVARWLYFGHLLPPTFAVKVYGDLPGQSGPAAVMAFCRHNGLAGLLAVFGVAHTPRRTWPLWIAAVLFVVFYTVPNHVMGYGFRFLAPLLPLLVILSTTGLVEALRAASRASWQGVWIVTVVVLMGLLAVQGFALGRHWPRSLEIAWEYAAGLEGAHLPLGRELRSIDPSGESWVALEDAGAISYLSGWNSLDLLGLNEPTIAFEGFDPAMVLARNPDVVVLVSRDPDRYDPWGWENQDLYGRLAAQGYLLSNVLPFRERDYHLFVLSRPGSDAWNGLRRTLPLPAAPPEPGA